MSMCLCVHVCELIIKIVQDKIHEICLALPALCKQHLLLKWLLFHICGFDDFYPPAHVSRSEQKSNKMKMTRRKESVW